MKIVFYLINLILYTQWATLNMPVKKYFWSQIEDKDNKDNDFNYYNKFIKG